MAFLDSRFNFIMVNRAYAVADGRPSEFFPGKNHFELYPHEENERIFRQVIETGEPFFIYAKPFEYPDQPERGTTWWDWSLIPVKDESGVATGLVFTLSDITERWTLQQKVSQLRREQEAFMRHEMKNLLAPMQLFSEMLLRDTENLTAEQVRFLRRIAETAEKAVGFIDSLKRIQDIENGKHALKRVRHPLDTVIRNVIHDIEPIAEKSGATIRLKTTEKNALMLLDKDLLPGVFTNLILNAIEHVAELQDPDQKVV
ncbi:MAG: sensor histidine kinase, partial [Candidatus Latescibacterota bacterium]